jgi:hypothetical protein
MKEKLNIAELLKDCPQGRELYSPIFGKVYLDKIRPHLAIVVTTDKEQGDFKEEFLYDGRYGMNGECMLFPSKGKTTWEGFQRPFKDMENCKDTEFEDIKVAYLSINDKDYADEIEVNLGDDYEYKFEMNRLYILKKKPKYPTTYAECCEVLVGRKPKPNEISFDKMELCLVDLDNTQSIDFQNPYLPQFNSLFRLRMCRDAYWKIAGEEMGLDNPWNSKYGYGKWGYWIGYDINSNKIYCLDSRLLLNRLLVFPTKEMQEAFYENFKDLIEQCKELL